MREVPEAGDYISRGLHFEEQRLSGLERFEGGFRPRLPEVHIINRRLDGAKEGEPIVVGIRDEAAHAAMLRFIEVRSVMSLLCAVLISRCATAPPTGDSHPQRMFAIPGDEVTKASADCPLRLELSGPLLPLVAGTKVTMPFVVRNVSKSPIKSCTIDGVSIRIRSESDGQWRMVVAQGKTFDADCSHPIRLGPGASESIAREMAVFSNLPPGPASLDVILAFDGTAYGSRVCGEALQWRETVTVLAPTQGR